jgi:hypothetical protein
METDPMLPEEAIEFVNQCKSDGKIILGVERLFSVGTKLILDNREIADFSMPAGAAQDAGKNAALAVSFINSVATGNSYFTVVVE